MTHIDKIVLDNENNITYRLVYAAFQSDPGLLTDDPSQ